MSAKSTIKKIFKMPEASRKPPSFLDRHALLFHIPFALLLCFVIEAISRHSALDSLRFIVNEPVAYIYNSYIIFVFLTICFLTRRQAFVRILVAALFIAMGIANGIILLNRVTPFGFSDIGMIGDLLTMQNTGYMSKGESIVIIAAIVVFRPGLCQPAPGHHGPAVDEAHRLLLRKPGPGLPRQRLPLRLRHERLRPGHEHTQEVQRRHRGEDHEGR